jgi:hypothetical protein
MRAYGLIPGVRQRVNLTTGKPSVKMLHRTLSSGPHSKSLVTSRAVTNESPKNMLSRLTRHKNPY